MRVLIAGLVCTACASPDVQFQTSTIVETVVTTVDATAPDVYEFEGLQCLTEFGESSVSDFQADATGADTRDEAVSQWIDDEVLDPDPNSLTQTENASGKVIFVDAANRAQIILDVRDDGNGWLVHGYVKCAPVDYSPSD